MIKKENNTFKITLGEKEFIVKELNGKGNGNIYLEGKDFVFKDIKELYVFVNWLTDVAEEITEEIKNDI